MVSHTGFLIFARYQECPEDWGQGLRLGTRERKQEAARQERLAKEYGDVLLSLDEA